MQLGVLYLNGWGVEKNPSETARWYSKAAEAEFAEAQYRLGQLYEKGLGVTQDFAKALNLYRAAAAQDHPGGLYCLGLMYANGNGGGSRRRDRRQVDPQSGRPR